MDSAPFCFDMIGGLETHPMTESFSTLRVNSDRMLDTFNQLALIGANVLLQTMLQMTAE